MTKTSRGPTSLLLIFYLIQPQRAASSHFWLRRLRVAALCLSHNCALSMSVHEGWSGFSWLSSEDGVASLFWGTNILACKAMENNLLSSKSEALYKQELPGTSLSEEAVSHFSIELLHIKMSVTVDGFHWPCWLTSFRVHIPFAQWWYAGLKCHLRAHCVTLNSPAEWGRQDGSEGQGTHYHTWQPEFQPQNWHGRKTELAHTGCSLTSTHALWHAHPNINVHTYTKENRIWLKHLKI